MKWNRIVVIMLTLVTSPQALAENIFAGVTLGQVSTKESDTVNLGLTAGYTSTEGFGFEAFYLASTNDDSASVSGVSGDISTDVWGIYGVYKYQSSQDIYVKGKLGYGVVKIGFDVNGGEHFEDSESGLSYGLAVGTQLGPGAIELSYIKLPNLDDFDNSGVEADTDIIALTYLWYL